jgi:enoyl-CoA hydratase/carnithine racemase
MDNVITYYLNNLEISNLENLIKDIKISLKNSSTDIFVIIINKDEKEEIEHIKFINKLCKEDVIHYISKGQELFSIIRNAKKLFVGIADGYVFDGYFELLLACDFIFSTKRSRFGFPCINYGIIPAFGSLKLLCRGIFEQFVKFLVLTGSKVNVELLYDKGIINKIFEDILSLQDYVNMLSKGFSNKSQFALGLMKEVVNHTMFASLEDALLIEQNAFCLSFCNDDRIEGIKAFLEKRAPIFKSRWEDIYS